MSGDDLRTIGHFPTLAEAALARNRLESGGIPAAIADDYVLTTDPLLAGAMNYIKVQVRADDLEKAQSLLAEPAPTIDLQEVFAEASDAELENDEDNGDDTVSLESEGERLTRFAYRAAMFGCISLPFILHAYSFYLLLRVAFFHPKLPPAANAQFYLALLVDAVFMSFAALLFLAIFRW